MTMSDPIADMLTRKQAGKNPSGHLVKPSPQGEG